MRPLPIWLQTAFSDWMTRRLYVDGRGNYRSRALGRRIEEILKEALYQPPELKQLAETLKMPPAELARLRTLLSAMEREGRVIKIATDFYFERAAFESAKAKLLERLQRDGAITAATYRDVLNASRKFAIALLDYFDHSGVTTRVGDTRKLRARG